MSEAPHPADRGQHWLTWRAAPWQGPSPHARCCSLASTHVFAFREQGTHTQPVPALREHRTQAEAFTGTGQALQIRWLEASMVCVHEVS